MGNFPYQKDKPNFDLERFEAFRMVFNRKHYKYFNRFLLIFAILLLIILFLPWTQTISGRGYLTTLTPDQRPQTLQSPIPGKIEKWYVREGDFVNKGDTILFISEVKSEYFDPQLLNRTEQQILDIPPVEMRISNRKILTGYLTGLGIENITGQK